MQQEALEIASRITHPVTVAAVGLVLAASALTIAMRAKKTRLAWLLAGILVVLALAPLASSTYLQSEGVYRVRVVVLGLDTQPVTQGKVTSSIGGELEQADGSWEIVIRPQARPANGKVTFFATVKDAFLSGSSTLVLGKDYYPTVSIPLDHPLNGVVRGVVVDSNNKSVEGAEVSIPGYPDVATSDHRGNFSLPAHAAEGQMINVRAQKGDLTAESSAIVGNSAELVLRKR